jgi:hypothetical protein
MKAAKDWNYRICSGWGGVRLPFGLACATLACGCLVPSFRVGMCVVCLRGPRDHHGHGVTKKG